MAPELERSAALLGEDAMARLARMRVLLVGVGGVGSWCAEALVRTGLGHLTIVDDDVVQPSNANRQLPATARTVGRRKVDALKERLAEVRPAADVAAVAARWTAEGAAGVELRDFDCVVDAIDSVAEKAALVRAAAAAGVPVFASMGAALRVDPTQVRVSPFSKIAGDGLARALRRRFKKDGLGPAPEFVCVHSAEPPLDAPARGSVMPVTAAFGMALASLALERARA